jgi:hypothetical protein
VLWSLAGGGYAFYSPCGIGFEDSADFIAYAAEYGHLLGFCAGGVGGVIEAPMVAIDLAGEVGADLVGIPADGDDGLYVLG